MNSTFASTSLERLYDFNIRNDLITEVNYGLHIHWLA
jgi:hypothetical protein